MGEAQYLEEIAEHGSVRTEKRFNVARVPSIEQVNHFFSLMRFGSRWHAFFSLMFFCGLRPIEICNLTTDMIFIDNGKWIGLVYPVGKPTPPGRPKNGEKPRKAVRKWNKIDERIGHFPPGSLESLRFYWQGERQQFGLLFPNLHKQYEKEFSRLRKKMIAHGFENWSTTSEDYFLKLKTLSGKTQIEHDVTPYSGRRFFISCYHWLVTPLNRQGLPDIIETQRRMAHTGQKDTMMYVYSWRALGLNDQQIGKGWDVLTGKNPTQRRLNEY